MKKRALLLALVSATTMTMADIVVVGMDKNDADFTQCNTKVLAYGGKKVRDNIDKCTKAYFDKKSLSEQVKLISDSAYVSKYEFVNLPQLLNAYNRSKKDVDQMLKSFDSNNTNTKEK